MKSCRVLWFVLNQKENKDEKKTDLFLYIGCREITIYLVICYIYLDSDQLADYLSGPMHLFSKFYIVKKVYQRQTGAEYKMQGSCTDCSCLITVDEKSHNVFDIAGPLL